jgi:hypothetical protein
MLELTFSSCLSTCQDTTLFGSPMSVSYACDADKMVLVVSEFTTADCSGVPIFREVGLQPRGSNCRRRFDLSCDVFNDKIDNRLYAVRSRKCAHFFRVDSEPKRNVSSETLFAPANKEVILCV